MKLLEVARRPETFSINRTWTGDSETVCVVLSVFPVGNETPDEATGLKVRISVNRGRTFDPPDETSNAIMEYPNRGIIKKEWLEFILEDISSGVQSLLSGTKKRKSHPYLQIQIRELINIAISKLVLGNNPLEDMHDDPEYQKQIRERLRAKRDALVRRK